VACTIEATPGHAAATSYLTIAEADAYFQTRIHATEWPALTADDKCRMLVWATRVLDQWVTWAGTPTTYEQRLAWPRFGLLTLSQDVVPDDEIPDGVKEAVCELAWNLRLEDHTRLPDQVLSGLTGLTAGPVSLQFARPSEGRLSDAQRIIAPNVLGPIRRWVLSIQGSGFASVPLVRV
jgi:DnaT-like ssDNA binding protein